MKWSMIHCMSMTYVCLSIIVTILEVKKNTLNLSWLIGYTSRVLSWGPDRLMGNVLSVCHRLAFLGMKPYGRHGACIAHCCHISPAVLQWLQRHHQRDPEQDTADGQDGKRSHARAVPSAGMEAAVLHRRNLSCDVPPRGTSAQPVVPGPCALCSLMGPCSCRHLRDTMNPPSRHPIMLSGEHSSSSFTPWIAWW